MNQRPEAKRKMKRLHDEHVKETSEGNTPIHPVQRSRQRRANNSKDLENFIIKSMPKQDGGPILRSHRGNLSRNPTHSSSSTQWEQHDDWKPNKSWNSWRSSSASRKVNHLAIDGVCRQIHLPHATFSHVQSLRGSHSTDDMYACLKEPEGPT